MYLLNRNILVIVFFFLNLSQFVSGQTFIIYKSDTVNKTDASNRKLGRWVFFFENSNQIEKEGFYENNRKTGIWKSYYENGNLMSEITYKNNQADGYAKIYYESGKVAEEGEWRGTMWVGNYNYYHDNGQKAYEWNFNENGKRSGVQKYYHENGKLLIKGEWLDGKENGVITEYFADGTIKSEKQFSAGQFDIGTSKFYDGKKVKVEDIPEDTNATVSRNNVEANTTENLSQTFNGNGFHKLYNAYKKIDREGEFKNGQLINGKRYYYNSEGSLIKTTVYKNGAISETIRENQN